jgi:hypothetical protein
MTRRALLLLLLGACSSQTTAPAPVDAAPAVVPDAAAGVPDAIAEGPDAGGCPASPPLAMPDPTCAGQVCPYSDWSCTCDPAHNGWVCDQIACPAARPLPEPCTGGAKCDVYFGHTCTCVATTQAWQCCDGPPPACPADPPTTGVACCARPSPCSYGCVGNVQQVCRCGGDDAWSCVASPC